MTPPTISSATYSQGYKGRVAKMFTSVLSRVGQGHFCPRSNLPPTIILNMGFGPHKTVAVLCADQVSQNELFCAQFLYATSVRSL